MSQVFGSAAVANPLRTCVNIGKVLRFVRFQKPFFQGFGQRFRMGAADKPDRCDRIVILYQLSCLFSRNDFNFSHSPDCLLHIEWFDVRRSFFVKIFHIPIT